MTGNSSKNVRTALPDLAQQVSNCLPLTPVTESEEPIQMDPPIAETGIPWWLALLPPRRRLPIAIAICLLGLLIVPAAARLHFYTLSLSQLSARNQVVSRTDYELLKVGMSVTDAQANIGRGIEVSSNAVVTVYRWTNGDGSGITAVFKNGLLVSKEQSGLR